MASRSPTRGKARIVPSGSGSTAVSGHLARPHGGRRRLDAAQLTLMTLGGIMGSGLFLASGQAIRYVETTKADIALADRLASQVLARSLDELPPGTRKLLGALHGYVSRRCEAEGLDAGLVRFTRRQLREALPFGDTQLKVHLARLTDYELVIPHRLDSGGFCYELAWQPGTDGTVAGSDAAATANRSALQDSRSGPGRGLVGGWSAPGRPALSEAKPQAGLHLRTAGHGDHRESTDPAPSNGHVIAASGGAR